ncbi:MAG: tRNA (adenosine(37)-N6)-dimethylallyltransferase MiaA [Myxococcota bacterium]|nr:tRNA (adenosine(37)-N6)-dimethylallyltransferase MiaA [Myxococcota bacterium]
MKKILILGGPTSAGKTAASLALADEWRPRIVSADAMQIYRGMDIGTGKLGPEWLERYPHAGIDVRNPEEEFNAVDFAELADREIEQAAAQNQPVVIVGGTGLYFRALLTGFVEAPSGGMELRKELEALEAPHEALRRVDPDLARRLHPNDTVRIVRGLEVHRLTGVPLSQLHDEHRPKPRYEAVCLSLDRPDLDERIDRRVHQMMEDGYLAEVERLLNAGYHPKHTKPMRSLGYRHLSEHLTDGLGLDEAIRRTQRDTRKFARRQRKMIRHVGGFETVSASEIARIRDAAVAAWGDPPAKALLDG